MVCISLSKILVEPIRALYGKNMKVKNVFGLWLIPQG
jgi:hypothetical protein